MKNIVIQNGVKYLFENNKFYEVLSLDNLIDNDQIKNLVISEDKFKVSINKEYFSMRKVPLFFNRGTSFVEDNVSGAYIIINYTRNKFYIGSTNNIKLRLYSHRQKLISNEHKNKNMQELYNEHNKDNLFLLYFKTENYLDLEQFLLDYFNSIPKYKDMILNVSTNARYSVYDGSKVILDRARQIRWADPTQRKNHIELMKSKWSDPAFREKMNEIYSSEEHKLQSSKAGSTLWNKLNSDERAKAEFLEKRRLGREANLHKWKNSIQTYMESDKFQEDVEKRRSTLQTDEHRQRASIKSKEVHANNPNLAKIQAEKLREYYRDPEKRLQKRLLNSNQFVPVVCDGIKYQGVAIACEKLGLTKNALRGRLASKSPTYGNWYYVNKI